MTEQTEFDGDQCIVLPSNYLESAESVAEIYEDQLSAATGGLDVVGFSQPGFFSGSLLALLLWTVPGIWTVCS
jgi:hypothetical protein